MSQEIPLLTVHLFSEFNPNHKKMIELTKKTVIRHINIKYYKPGDSLHVDPKSPRMYLSIGGKEIEYTTLYKLPMYERRRWLHYNSFDQIQPNYLFFCWLSATDPLPKNKELPLTQFSSEEPLISIFTATYKSGEKIQRPFQSLLKQTYKNWEWVIVDDSGDNDHTYNHYLSNLNDPRIRCYRQQKRRGYIGSIKRDAAGLCTGEILVEVDHDDELTPDALEKIVQAFKQNPECGFAFGECTEVHWNNKHAHCYGWDFGFGYGLYYRVWVHQMNRWQNVLRTADLNWQTIRHLVGLPNHPRAWTRDCYHFLGGHRPELLVADDYDLLVRSFLCTKYVRIPHLLYIQYLNDGGDNSTFTRNKQIQILCQEIEAYYQNRINNKIEDLKLPSLQNILYTRIWRTSKEDIRRKTSTMVQKDSSRKSVIFPLPYTVTPQEEDYSKLIQTLENGITTEFKDFEVIIIGNIPDDIIEKYASRAPSGTIRWWPMEKSSDLEECIRYGEFCSSCEEIEVLSPSTSFTK